ncbi:MAG: hypothetical protein A2021_03805 [Elusimicrobia bacterium GWF2_52_66]|nr:MAG: hypothetical protein A2X33_10090 [Elusimicrobia bacterium GWA2_51_34]OGR84713.1 MAG: hypothetical protein A2021_03805 [Elusimicrobia bacterium GWF2_52_66]
MILGKLKGKRGDFVKVLSSTTEVDKFKNFLDTGHISTSQAMEFESNYRADVGEWLYIDLSNDRGIIDPFKNAALNTTNLNPLGTADIKSIHLFYNVTKKQHNGQTVIDKLYFQQVLPSAKMHKAGYLSLAGEPHIKIETDIVALHAYVDSIWDEDTKRLYFHKFEKAHSMFPDLDKFFRAATDEEVATFTRSEIFAPAADLNLKTRNRNRIANILKNKADLLTREKFPKLKKYIKDYNLPVQIARGKLVLENANADVVIKALSEFYYTAEISGEKREANSTHKHEPTPMPPSNQQA